MPKLRIVLDEAVYQKVLAFTMFTNQEFSGNGFCELDKDQNIIFVYDFVPLHIGTWATTEIPHERVLPLMHREDKANMLVWLHKHPCGNGIPGMHNWSSTDNNNIFNTPMGSTPDNIDFMVSIVMTPEGLVGRIDKYRDGKVITKHLEVSPNIQSHKAEFRALLPAPVTKPLYRYPDGVAQELGLFPEDDEIWNETVWDEEDFDAYIDQMEAEVTAAEEKYQEEKKRFGMFDFLRGK